MARFGARYAELPVFRLRSPIKGGDRSSISISYFFNVQTGFLEQHTVRNFCQGLFLAEACTVSRNVTDFLPGIMSHGQEFLPRVVSGRSVHSQQERIRFFARDYVIAIRDVLPYTLASNLRGL
jgi:hypothetical protein